MEGCTMRRLWHENMPHSSTLLNNCRVYAAGSMDETLPMFYDGSMQNIKEHTADFDVADFEPEANEHSCPPCAVGPSLHGDRVGERAAGHAGDRAVDRVAGYADDCGDSQAARCVESQTRCYVGAQEEGRAGDRVGRRVGGRAEVRAGGRADNRAEARVGGRIDGRAQGPSHSQLDASGEEDFAGFVKHNIASGGIFGGVPGKGTAPQNRSATDWGIDVAVALVAFAFGCAQMVITASSVVHVDAGPYGSSWVNYVPNIYAYLAVALTTAPLILRREAPWFVLALTLACYVFLSNSMGGTVSLSPIGPIVAVYTVASERARGEALAAAAVVGVCAAVVPMGASSVAMALVMRIENVAFVVVAALGGFGVRMYHAYMEETRRRLAEAERTREELAARRVADERVRIAREVHDITAHSLSAVTIQAAAAERLIDLNPAAAKEAIADIRSVSKSSLDEIRSLIGVLRGDEAAEHAPAEGTERMGDVVSFLQRAGIEVDFDESDYDKAQVPAFVDMALFSLARESATNAVRHAHAAHICIELASSPSKAVLVFSDDGVGMGSGVREHAEGHGLEGMGERIEALNGAFTIESEPGRGCTIRAEVPLEVVHDDEHR